jgi:hypothetical protein
MIFLFTKKASDFLSDHENTYCCYDDWINHVKDLSTKNQNKINTVYLKENFKIPKNV